MAWLLLAAVIILPFAVAAITGAPWLPTLRRDAEAALNLANLKPGQTIIDLGSGDGRLLATAARHWLRNQSIHVSHLAGGHLALSPSGQHPFGRLLARAPSARRRHLRFSHPAPHAAARRQAYS